MGSSTLGEDVCCEGLARICRETRDTHHCTAIVAVLLAVKLHGPVGRRDLARMLGLGERKVRNIVEKLAREGYLRVTRAGSSLSEYAKKLLGCISMISCNGSTLCGVTSASWQRFLSVGSIVRVRDLILALMGSTRGLTLIGLVDPSDTAIAPGVDRLRDFVSSSEELCLSKIEPGSLFALFREESCYTCCAAFAQAVCCE
ncbi:MAG: hypothetical protein ABWW70_06375 [Thermoproteota archaeon]